ncbi:hypothetical protein ACFPRL_30445 [Pseudoclavibacter helvolus]
MAVISASCSAARSRSACVIDPRSQGRGSITGGAPLGRMELRVASAWMAATKSP